MVNDKAHCRNNGPMVVLMDNQQREDLAMEVLDLEMERDCMVSRCDRFTKDRFISNAFQVYSCKKCGMMAVFNNERKFTFMRHVITEQTLIE